MPIDDYERLIDALDRLPNGFPRTPSRGRVAAAGENVRAGRGALAGQLGGEMEPVDAIAERVGLPEKEASTRSEGDGAPTAWSGSTGRSARCATAWRRSSWVSTRRRSSAWIMSWPTSWRTYFADGGTAGIMGPEPALHRVMPARSRGEVRVGAALRRRPRHHAELAKTFHVRDCICRVQQDQLGHRCGFPLNMCLCFSDARASAAPGDISRDEALALLERAEESRAGAHGQQCRCKGSATSATAAAAAAASCAASPSTGIEHR